MCDIAVILVVRAAGRCLVGVCVRVGGLGSPEGGRGTQTLQQERGRLLSECLLPTVPDTTVNSPAFAEWPPLLRLSALQRDMAKEIEGH
jgi:hypothetical protein